MSGFDTYGVCPCGHSEHAPFGKLLHTHLTVCPKCGVDLGYWKVVVGRRVNVGSFWRPRYEIVPPADTERRHD